MNEGLAVDIVSVAFVAAALFAAGLAKGALGFGLRPMAIGLLVLRPSNGDWTMPLLFPCVCANLWLLLGGPDLPGVFRRFWRLAVAIAIGSAALPWLPAAAGRWPGAVTGAGLIFYACFRLRKTGSTIPAERPRRSMPAADIVIGLVSGATGLFAVPAIPFLRSLPLDRETRIQALGLVFVTATVGFAVVRGPYDPDQQTIGLSMLLTAPVFTGMFFGQTVRRASSEREFERWSLGGLVFVGAAAFVGCIAS